MYYTSSSKELVNMDVDQMTIAEKQVYWKAFFEQRTAIDEFRAAMIELNPEYGTVDSQPMMHAIEQAFAGNYEHDFARRAVAIYRDEEIAKQLQSELDFEFTQALA